MKILHLCFDGHGLNRFIPIFDHFYPDRNIWYVTEDKKNAHRMSNIEGDNIHWLKPWINKDYLQQILELSKHVGIDRIVCHGITGFYLEILRLLFEEKKYKVYWLFWGFEMYRALGFSGKMRLIDNASPFNPMSYIVPTKWACYLWKNILGHKGYEKSLMDFLEYADYFCFWLYEDFLLLQKHYPNHLEFRHFQYGARWKDTGADASMPERYFEKKPRTIIVNHQASTTGNHVTVLKKLKSFKGIKDYQITAPLSYGSRMVRRTVSCWGKWYFRDKFHALVDYVPRDEYFNIVGSVEVAIFGQIRQEAAGNLVFYLANGTKVFMREESTLFQNYKKQGFIIFSFEHDLNSVEDLVGLTLEQKQHNARVTAANTFYYEDFMPSLLDD